jgi:hypothetical protein
VREAEARKAREAATPFGWEVGVGQDFSHLNKRRQRRRDMGVERDVKWMKKVERARASLEATSSPSLSPVN